MTTDTGVRQKNRLVKLADLLDTLKSEQFDLTHWVTKQGDTACAVGWAALSPQFAGLTFLGPAPQYLVKGHHPALGFVAAERYFGLRFREAHYLFSIDSYRRGSSTRPTTVARRIRRFIAKKEAT